MGTSGEEAPAFAFDAFVSYRQAEPDRSWVRGRLVPALRSRGLAVCLDHDSFRLGAPLVTEMGRAVEASAYTVAVLSPAYLESSFTELESVLAEHVGLEQRRNRLIVVLRSPAVPRIGLRARLWLDMTDDADFDDAIEALCRTIGTPPT